MSLKKVWIAGLAALSLGLGSAAHAGFVTLNYTNPGASTVSIVPNNEFKSVLAGVGVTKYTLSGVLGVDEIGSVSYFYYGKEAGYQNVFLTNQLLYATGVTPTLQNHFAAPDFIGTEDVGLGPLDFAFCAFSAPGISQGCVSNRQNDRLSMNSYQSIAFSANGDFAWLFWDDSGAGPDDNHDDMIIKAVFTPRAVPEPATLGLFGLGLLGVWAGTRRRVRNA